LEIPNERVLQIVAVIELVLCWFAWALGFVGARKKASGQKKTVRARASWMGFFLQAVGFSLVWAYVRPAGFEKSALSLIASMIIAPLSAALAWSAVRHLGKQWRYEAALNQDHELIQTGPYRFVRHPIYLSMLGMFLATGAAWTWWPLWVAACIPFLAGTEIRMQAEDRLLAERFKESFTAYRSRVSAYIPFIR
jgi:protein-S-isoprenylcysteine O-methyltransferase Ste14